jgi:hypothetical protein
MAEIPVIGWHRPATCDDRDYAYLNQFEWHGDEDGPYRLIGYARLYMGDDVLLQHPEIPPPSKGPWRLVLTGQGH